MKLSVTRLLSDKLDLELPGRNGGRPNLVVLEAGVNVRGTFATRPGVVLDRVTADALGVTRVRWSLGNAVMQLGPVRLRGVAVDLDIVAGQVRGAISIAELQGGGHEMVLGPKQNVYIERLEARDVMLRFGDDGVHVALRALDLLGITARFERLLPENKAKTYEDLIDDARAAEAKAKAHASMGDTPAVPFLDWRFLDTIDGRIDVDLGVDIALPVIGHHQGMHELRVPIVQGTIDYDEAEHQLAAIEDALVDFELEDGRLVLEKDIPFVPGREILLYWPLDASEQQLAKEHKVRLSTLMAAMRPSKTPNELAEEADDAREAAEKAWKAQSRGKRPQRKSVRLLALDLDAVAIELRFSAPAPEQRGAFEIAGRIAVQGALHYRPEGEPPPPSELHVALDDLHIATRGVSLGRGALRGSCRADVDDLVVSIAGASPQTMTLTTDKIALVDVAFTVPAV